MKKIIILFCICCFTVTFAQQTSVKPDRWDKYTSPNTDNYFYHHFKKYIEKDLISTKYFNNNTSKIILEFNLDSIYNVENIRVNTKSKTLEDAILKGLKEIDFSKISIQAASKFHNYSLQLLAIENGKAVLKCSSNVLNEVPPILDGCEQKLNYKDYHKCFTYNTIYYIETAFDTTKISEKNTLIYPKVSFGKNGKLSLINVESDNSLLIEGTEKSIQNFNQRFKPATLNGVIDDYEVGLVLDTDDMGESNKSNFFENASSNSELANHFKKQIPTHLINKEQLNLKQNSVRITYSYNNKNQIENIKTNAENKSLNDALIQAFQKLPSDKYIVSNINLLSGYAFQVIAYENKENIIKCSDPAVIPEVLPVFDTCEKSKTIVELRKCNQESLSKYVSRNFNTNLARGLEPGVKRIYAIFKISKTGEITDIKVKAPNNNLENETIRVLEKYKVISPGYQRGKPVNVKYSLPIAFKVEGSNKMSKFDSPSENNAFRNY